MTSVWILFEALEDIVWLYVCTYTASELTICSFGTLQEIYVILPENTPLGISSSRKARLLL